MYFVYIIYSAQVDRYYVGHSDDVLRRLAEHCVRKNSGATDWQLKYTESYESRGEAMRREMEIKKKKRRSYLDQLISSAG